MSIGDPIIQPIPAVGTTGTLYASMIVAFLQEVQARLEAKIPFSSLLAGLFDLDNNPLVNVQYVGLYNQATNATEPAGSVFRYNGNLWYMHPDGAAQITLGANLNAASLGTIGGDYGGANPASVQFVDADQEYYFYDNFGTGAWAYVAARAFDIHGTATGAGRVRLSWAGGVGYTITVPTTAPASTSVLQMDATGNLTASNTIVNPLAMAVNQNMSVSGTGKYAHGTKTFIGNVTPGTSVYFSGGSLGSGPSYTGVQIPASSVAYVPLPPLDYDKRIKSVTVYLAAAVGSSVSYALALARANNNIWLDLSANTGYSTITAANQALMGMSSGPWLMDGSGLGGIIGTLYVRVTTPAATTAVVTHVGITYDAV